jgi:hypothetical protein
MKKILIDVNATKHSLERHIATAINRGVNNIPMGKDSSSAFDFLRGYERGAMDAANIALGMKPVDAVEVAEYNAVIEKLENLLCHATGGKYSKAGYSLEDMERMVTDYIEECCQEAVEDEVVRCKDCRRWDKETGFCIEHSHFFSHGLCWNMFDGDDFCSYGERKENG